MAIRARRRPQACQWQASPQRKKKARTSGFAGWYAPAPGNFGSVSAAPAVSVAPAGQGITGGQASYGSTPTYAAPVKFGGNLAQP